MQERKARQLYVLKTDVKTEEIPQFQFWDLVFVNAVGDFLVDYVFREANFTWYCQALSALIPFFFANNNVDYSRWLPIHLKDMVSLEQTHPQLANEFQRGEFVVHKTHRECSGLAIDQAHEQANAVVKGDGGAIGITEDPSALRRWIVSGPVVSRLVSQYESTSQVKVASEDVSGCKTECRGRCKCYRFGLKFTQLCACKCDENNRNPDIQLYIHFHTLILFGFVYGSILTPSTH